MDPKAERASACQAILAKHPAQLASAGIRRRLLVRRRYFRLSLLSWGGDGAEGGFFQEENHLAAWSLVFQAALELAFLPALAWLLYDDTRLAGPGMGSCNLYKSLTKCMR